MGVCETGKGVGDVDYTDVGWRALGKLVEGGWCNVVVVVVVVVSTYDGEGALSLMLGTA